MAFAKPRVSERKGKMPLKTKKKPLKEDEKSVSSSSSHVKRTTERKNHETREKPEKQKSSIRKYINSNISEYDEQKIDMFVEKIMSIAKLKKLLPTILREIQWFRDITDSGKKIKKNWIHLKHRGLHKKYFFKEQDSLLLSIIVEYVSLVEEFIDNETSLMYLRVIAYINMKSKKSNKSRTSTMMEFLTETTLQESKSSISSLTKNIYFDKNVLSIIAEFNGGIHPISIVSIGYIEDAIIYECYSFYKKNKLVSKYEDSSEKYRKKYRKSAIENTQEIYLEFEIVPDLFDISEYESVICFFYKNKKYISFIKNNLQVELLKKDSDTDNLDDDFIKKYIGKFFELYMDEFNFCVYMED